MTTYLLLRQRRRAVGASGSPLEAHCQWRQAQQRRSVIVCTPRSVTIIGLDYEKAKLSKMLKSHLESISLYPHRCKSLNGRTDQNIGAAKRGQWSRWLKWLKKTVRRPARQKCWQNHHHCRNSIIIVAASQSVTSQRRVGCTPHLVKSKTYRQ